jgi:hypothetical protein
MRGRRMGRMRTNLASTEGNKSEVEDGGGVADECRVIWVLGVFGGTGEYFPLEIYQSVNVVDAEIGGVEGVVRTR